MFEIRPDLTKANILKRVDSLSIFERYCPNFKKPEIKFRERSDDSQPSCIIGMWNGDYLYKDFGTTGSYRAIDYVAYKHGESFRDALKRINQDFELGLDPGLDSSNIPKSESEKLNLKSNLQTSRSVLASVPSVIKVKRSTVSLSDIKFWESFGWTQDLLEVARIYPISHYWITNPKKGLYNYKTRIPKDRLAYTFDYYSHKDVFRRKLYFPDQIPKFISNVDYTVVQGYPALPRYGDILIITSSLKDCGPLWRLGYPAIAPNTENEFFYKEYIEKLKSRFKNIIIYFDNDAAGLKYAQTFSKVYDLRYIYNPIEYPKDPSDFVFYFGIEEFEELITTLINNL